MFYQVQTWHAIRAMSTDSSLKEGHVYVVVQFFSFSTLFSELVQL